MDASYTILWLLLCVHESQCVEGRKMNNYYTVMIYLTLQIKNASNYINTLNLILLFKAVV